MPAQAAGAAIPPTFAMIAQKASKGISEALLADLAVIRTQTRPKGKTPPIDFEFHVNPAAIGVTLVGAGLALWLCQLRLGHRYQYQWEQKDFVIELPLDYTSWRSYLPQDYAFSDSEKAQQVGTAYPEVKTSETAEFLQFSVGIAVRFKQAINTLLINTENNAQQTESDSYHIIHKRVVWHEPVYEQQFVGMRCSLDGSLMDPNWTKWQVRHWMDEHREHGVYQEFEKVLVKEGYWEHVGYIMYATGYKLKAKHKFDINERKGFQIPGSSLL